MVRFVRDRNPLLAWRWERSSAYTLTNLFLLLCLGYAAWGALEFREVLGTPSISRPYGVRRMTLAALAVLTVQALTALGCTVRAYRVGRGRIREVAELTPITPRQALFALVDWPMYKVLGFAAMIGVIAAAAGLGDVEIPDSHSGLDLVLDAISWALALTWAAYRIVQCAVFRAFATMRHYAYHASAGVFLLWMAVEFNWGSEAAHWLVLLSVTLLLHCTLFLPGHRTASDTAVGAVPKEATSR